MSSIAVVTPRFGGAITGGAELLARLVATRLAGAEHAVTVLTTCAEDYVTWANSLPPGESRDGPLRVLRFPVRAPRDLERWNASMQPILRLIWSDADEREALREQGPDAPGLLDHLRESGSGYDAVIFFTLLYLPTVEGIQLVWDRSILVPTLHDELSVYLDAHGRAIRAARFLIWNTPEERTLAERIYDVADLPGAVAGVGVDVAPPDALRVADVRQRFRLDRPYLLYAGRIDPEKGCGEMLDWFTAWSRRDPRADLVLAGRPWMTLPDEPRIRAVGYVQRGDLQGLMEGALATVVPSRNESLSMVLLESLGAGTPALVVADGGVLEGHARRSGAALTFRDGPQFAEVASRLLDDPELRRAMSDAGRRYVAASFTWERVMGVYERAVADVARRASRRGVPRAASGL